MNAARPLHRLERLTFAPDDLCTVIPLTLENVRASLQPSGFGLFLAPRIARAAADAADAAGRCACKRTLTVDGFGEVQTVPRAHPCGNCTHDSPST